TWQQVVMRFVFFLGVLAAAGATFFALVALRGLGTGAETERRHQVLLGASFLLAFVGADALIHATLGTATRFERVLDVAAVVSVVGAAAIGIALWVQRAIWVAWAASAVLFVCPTLAGHALDDDQPRFLAPLADLLHVGAAAVWLGGLASLAFVVTCEGETTRA